MTLNSYELLLIKKIIAQGGIIAYPTEAVYGLGCDPFNENAVEKLLKIKHRPTAKGLIIIASSWHQIKPLIQPLEQTLLDKVSATWPGPVTWLFPAQQTVPKWLIGEHKQIAIRMTAHPIAKEICHFLDMPIVSTSANLSQQQPMTTAEQIKNCFGDQIDHIVVGEVGKLSKPTMIRDVITDKIIRE